MHCLLLVGIQLGSRAKLRCVERCILSESVKAQLNIYNVIYDDIDKYSREACGQVTVLCCKKLTIPPAVL